jgi:hypothetical protein|tara:strand:+ start:3718 stop:4029 length:312 start_codon:yes stop_codon:yes gene_type:complete
MKPKCIKCDRSVWSVSRTRTLIEYRILSDTGRDTGVDYKFDSTWKKEKDTTTKKLFVRCNSCNYVFDKKDYPGHEGISEVLIKKDGVIFVHNKFIKFFGEDDE